MLHIKNKLLHQHVFKLWQKSSAPIQNKKEMNLCTKANSNASNVISSVKNFYNNGNVLITGATGFMGKVLVEKLLRSCVGLNNVYVLIRPKRGKDSVERLRELLNSQVFDRLKNERPKAIAKVIGVNGDVELPGLGLNERDYKMLSENVTVVFHSAANISLAEMESTNFSTILSTNLGGTRNVLHLCHKMNKIKSLVYLSSAYCNSEVPNEIKERIYPLKEMPEEILEVLKNADDVQSTIPKLKKQLNISYLYAKRMTENFILYESKSLSVAIVRPSMVGSAWKEPEKGWVDSFVSINQIMLLTGMGLIRVWPVYSNMAMDVVPVDTSINCVIASAWYASEYRPNLISVFHHTSCDVNRITNAEFSDLVIANVRQNPFNEVFLYPNVTLIRWKPIFEVWAIAVSFIPAFFADILLRIRGKKPVLVDIQRKAHRMIAALSILPYDGLQFDNSKMFEMWDAMNAEDQQEFFFDIRRMSWPSYINESCLGMKTYGLKENILTMPLARKHMEKKYNIYKFLHMVAITTTLCCSFGCYYIFY